MDHSDEETTGTNGGDELTEATQQVRSIRNLLLVLLVGLVMLRKFGLIYVPTWIIMVIALVASLLPMLALARAMATKMPPDTRS
ncbi:MAG: hypothetical protein ACPHRO_00085 [Nannocystaceae bacterium]